MASRKELKTPPLISYTSILILSAYIIGALSARIGDARLQLAIYLAGAFGLVAYFGLGLIARRRVQRLKERSEQAMVDRLNRRVSQVVQSPATAQESQPEYEPSGSDADRLPLAATSVPGTR